MTKVQFGQLPPTLQAQVRAQLGDDARRLLTTGKPRVTRKQVSAAECHATGTCSCGLTFDTFNKYEKHRRTTATGRHGRYCVNLTRPPQTESEIQP